MYVITNRVLHEDKKGLSVFGKEPNPLGPNELRLVKVAGSREPEVKVLEDELKLSEVKSLSTRYNLDLDLKKKWYASLRVACELYAQAQKQKKHLLFFVHGYNNDISDVLRTANELESLYRVIVVPFSWPANGGGKISGTAAYLDDKDDARSSATAFHRAVQKIHFYHRILTKSIRTELLEKCNNRHPDNAGKARSMFTQEMGRKCQATLNLICHSMGNYVLKYASKPSGSSLRKLVFDNICLVAADVNNPGHESWVQTLPSRGRLYVVINENDSALKWSRRKPGAEQLERLGNHLRNLYAANAYYIDVTRNKGVGSEHSYFKGRSVRKNATLKRIFLRIFAGSKAETALKYHADINVYRS